MSATAGGVAGFSDSRSRRCPRARATARQIVPFVKHAGNRLFDHNRHPADNENYVAGMRPAINPARRAGLSSAGRRVSPNVSLRDDTARFPDGKPAGGWW
jgi:hypothetical protein